MGHDVFLSYASPDQEAADALVAALEREGLRCWIAHRDVRASRTYPAEIVRAIEGCRAMVLVFSAHVNASEDVAREVHLAEEADKPVLPVRIEPVEPEGDLRYTLAAVHWLDAWPLPVERHAPAVVAAVRELMAAPDAPAASAPRPASVPRPVPGQRSRTPFLAGLLGLALVTVLLLAPRIRREAPRPPPTDPEGPVEAEPGGEDDPPTPSLGSDCDRVASLTVGTSVSGTLGPGDCQLPDGSFADFYGFRLAAPTVLQIELTSHAFDAFLGLRGTGADTLSVDDNDSGGGTQARITRRLGAGTYRVIANTVSAGESGPYTLVARNTTLRPLPFPSRRGP